MVVYCHSREFFNPMETLYKSYGMQEIWDGVFTFPLFLPLTYLQNVMDKRAEVLSNARMNTKLLVIIDIVPLLMTPISILLYR